MTRVLAGWGLSPEEWLRVVRAGSDPAANTEFSVAVPGSEVWEVISLTATLVTDANAANRRVRLIVDDGTTTVAELVASADHTAGLTVQYTFARGVSDGGAVAVGALQVGLPPLILLPGYRLRSSTLNIQATDNWGAPALLVKAVPLRTETQNLRAAGARSAAILQEAGIDV